MGYLSQPGGSGRNERFLNMSKSIRGSIRVSNIGHTVEGQSTVVFAVEYWMHTGGFRPKLQTQTYFIVPTGDLKTDMARIAKTHFGTGILRQRKTGYCETPNAALDVYGITKETIEPGWYTVQAPIFDVV